MNSIWKNRAIVATLTVIAVGAGLLDFYMPMTGDDLKFWSFLGLEDFTAPNRRTISFILAHIFGCNGRLFDYMGPIVTNLLPHGVTSVLMGAMGGLFFYSVLAAARVPARGRTAFAMILMAVVMAVMPWWDSMFMRVCQFNYSWATTFCLLFFCFFFGAGGSEDSRTKRIGLFLISFFAGASHEQAAVAMCGAMGFWLIYNRNYKSLSPRRKVMLIGLAAGSLLPVGAPSIWHRAATENAHPDVAYIMIIALPALLLLLAVIAAISCSGKGRCYLRRALTADCLVMLLAALIAGAIALWSGIPGRTGFLSEALALVVFARMTMSLDWHIGTKSAWAVSVLAFAFIAVHLGVSVCAQRKLCREHDEVVELYRNSPDGIVYYDFTGRRDVSPLTLFRVKGVPDADDYWSLYVLADTYGSSEHQPVVLPAAFEGRLGQLQDSISIGQTTVYSSKPADVVVTIDDVVLQHYPGPAPRAVTRATMADGREIWIATPRVRDPGDYSLPVKSSL